MTLTDREESLVRALSRQIRMVVLCQILRTFWTGSTSSERNCRKRLALLSEHGLLNRVRVLAHPVLDLGAMGPVYRWQPGEPAPDPHRVSWQLQSRWTEPLRPTTVYLATPRAASIFGGASDGKVRNQCQVTHDVHVSEIYLHLKRSAPTLAAAWVGEDILAPSRKGQKLPDAILHDEAGNPRLVMECGGKYPPERVLAFHSDNERRGLAYELY